MWGVAPGCSGDRWVVLSSASRPVSLPRQRTHKVHVRKSKYEKSSKNHQRNPPKSMQKRFRERVSEKSGPKASRRHPRSVPARPESVPGVSRSLPGATRARPESVPGRPEIIPERLRSVPGPSRRRPKSSRIARKAPRTDFFMILVRFWLTWGSLGALPERCFL